MIPKTMKAVVYYDRGKCELREIPVPQVGDDDILLEVKAAGVCGSDMHIYRGEWGPEELWNKSGAKTLIPGHEFAGIVAAKGKNVDDFWQIGDRVISDNVGHACGRCYACQRGDVGNCEQELTLGCHMDGAFAQYVLIPGDVLKVHPSGLMKLPESIKMTSSPCLEPACNAYKSLFQEAQLLPGETVCVIGPGALGLMAVQMAKIGGAAKIILVARTSSKNNRVPIAEKFGVTHVVYSDVVEDTAAEVRKIAGPNGVAVVFDNIGTTQCMKDSIAIVRSTGVVLRVGEGEKAGVVDFESVSQRGIRYQGHNGFNSESWRNCISLAAAGILDLDGMVTHTLPLEDYLEGYSLMANRKSGKVILLPNGKAD